MLFDWRQNCEFCIYIQFVSYSKSQQQCTQVMWKYTKEIMLPRTLFYIASFPGYSSVFRSHMRGLGLRLVPYAAQKHRISNTAKIHYNPFSNSATSTLLWTLRMDIDHGIWFVVPFWDGLGMRPRTTISATKTTIILAPRPYKNIWSTVLPCMMCAGMHAMCGLHLIWVE